MLKLPLFLALLLLVRGVPAVLYRHEVPERRERTALALFSATGLPLIVAITTVGIDTGHMRANTAAALVGAGMLSVVLFPMIATGMLKRTGDRAPVGAAVDDA